MCLSIAIDRPGDVLATGEHLGFEWQVVHNGRGIRCGYVRVPPGHPWHGKHWDDDPVSSVSVHGGITFGAADKPCEKGGPDNAWWLGFDCCHAGDRPDPSLPNTMQLPSEYQAMMPILDLADSMFSHSKPGDSGVRSQEYVESECRSLCEQAALASKENNHGP